MIGEIQSVTKSNRLDIDKARHIHAEIIKCKEVLTDGFLFLGQKLCEFQDEKLYQSLGYETFEEYLGTPEIGFQRSWAYGLMRMYRLFVWQLGIDAERLKLIGSAKLDMIAPIVDKDNVDNWLEKASHLSLSDLRKERFEERQNKSDRGIEEVILTLSLRQVVELYFTCGGNLEDDFCKRILQYREFRYVITRNGEMWKAIKF